MSKTIKILLADDEADIYEPILRHLVSQIPEVSLETAISPAEAYLAATGEYFDFILLDVAFESKDCSGLMLLEKLKIAVPESSIIMFSCFSDNQTKVRALKLGASDFVSKTKESLTDFVAIIRAHYLTDEKAAHDVETGRLVAEDLGVSVLSPEMQEVYKNVAIAKRSPSTPVLITGETGTGKDVIANAIRSQRRPFVSVDCGAVSEALAEATFFGHEKGAFTGAISASRGHFQNADGGDLFLDEIGNLGRDVQTKLLRAVQNNEITPVGGKALTVATRVIAATNENLADMVSKALFREDLWHRLKGISIHIPPLRERPEDIEPTIRSVLKDLNAAHIRISPTCLDLLKVYSWPGNVRELRHILMAMITRADGGMLLFRHFPDDFRRRLLVELDQINRCQESVVLKTSMPKGADMGTALSLFRQMFIGERIRELPKGSSKSEIASSLGISRHTLNDYLKELTSPATLISRLGAKGRIGEGC